MIFQGKIVHPYVPHSFISLNERGKNELSHGIFLFLLVIHFTGIQSIYEDKII